MSLQTTAAIRVYANGAYGPATSGPCTAVRDGHGLVITEYGLTAGSVISLAFTVARGAKYSYFKFVSETDSTTKVAFGASISRQPNNVEIIRAYGGNQTTTDQAHAGFQDKQAGESTSNPAILDLEPGTYYYNVWAEDGAAHPAPVGFQNSN